MPDILLSIKTGKIRGIKRISEYSGRSYFSFLGIPYAVAPVDDLRFKLFSQPPIPPENWNGIFNATKEKNDCIQFSLYLFQMVGSEDCLYLNVHVPERPSKVKQPKAVMVLIHGGSLLWGSASENVYGSPEYVMHRDVVYVTINYRLHVLGFLNLNLPDCPGNVGMKDIVMGLQWIKENIRFFGGDQNNVTLIGGSCGAIIIHFLLLSPLTKGLFHKVIMQGMYVFHPFVVYEKNHAEVAFKFAKSLGFIGHDRGQLLDFLKTIPIQRLMKELHNLTLWAENKYKKIGPSSPFALSIEIDGEDAFMPKSPAQLVKTMHPVPVVYGVCELENMFALFPAYRQRALYDFRTIYRQNIHSWSHSLSDKAVQSVEKEIKSRYVNENDDENEQLLSILMTQQDLIVLDFYDTIANVIFDISPSTPVYVYQFEFRGDLNETSSRCQPLLAHIFKGTFHFDDMHYWMCRNPKPNSRDAAMVETITKLFSAFAKTGSPNFECSSVKWKPTTLEQPRYLKIGECLTLEKGQPDKGRLLFWKEIKKLYHYNK